MLDSHAVNQHRCKPEFILMCGPIPRTASLILADGGAIWSLLQCVVWNGTGAQLYMHVGFA
jgi:hypothetical protein